VGKRVTQIIEDARLHSVTIHTNGDHDRFQHWFTKKAISDNLMDGKPMVALCGRVVLKQTDPKGRTVCSECQDIYDNVVGTNLPNRGDD
jgi:hypothetical protein